MREVSAVEVDGTSEQVGGADVRLEQLAELADALVAQVSSVREHYEELQRTLDDEPALEELEPTIGGARS